MRDQLHTRPARPRRRLARVPAVVRGRQVHAEARDHRPVLHDDASAAVAEVQAPGVLKTQGEAEGGHVQPDTGGLGRVRDAVGRGDRELVQLLEVAPLPADDRE